MKRIFHSSSLHRSLSTALLAFVLLLLAGCGDDYHDHDDHGHSHDDHDDSADAQGHSDHGHGHGAAIAVTQYTDDSELFMEYEPLRKDAPTELIIHLTRLSDFTPITEGALEVRLVSASGQRYSQTADAPARDGIFLPIIAPPFTGPARLELHLRSPQLDDVHVVKNVEIHPLNYHPPHEEEEPEDPKAISFLKEQQWKIDYALEQVEERPIQQAIPAVATVRLPSNGQSLLPAPSSGIVRFADASETVETGAAVRQGQTLFTLEPDSSWQAGLAKLSEDYQLAKAELDRVRSLQEQNAVSERRVLEAEIRLRTLEAALRQTGGDAALEDPSQLRALASAPFSGILAEIYVTPGQRVEAGDPLARVVALSKLVLEAQVVPARLGSAGTISDAVFRPGGSDRLYRVSELRGRILSTTPIADPRSGVAIVRFLFDNPDQKLIAGTKASAHLLAGDREATGVAVPVAAIHEEEGVPIVYVQTAGETVEKRYPRFGVSDGEYVHAKTGVAAGERVVTEGATFIRLSTLSTGEMGHGHAH